MRGLDTEGIDCKLIARRKKDDFRPAFLVSHFCCDISSQHTGHTDIEQYDIKIHFFFKGIQKQHGIIIPGNFDFIRAVCKIRTHGVFHDIQLFRYIVTKGNPQHSIPPFNI